MKVVSLIPYHMIGTRDSLRSLCSDWACNMATDIFRPEVSLQPDSVTKRQPIMLTPRACIIPLVFVLEVVVVAICLVLVSRRV